MRPASTMSRRPRPGLAALACLTLGLASLAACSGPEVIANDRGGAVRFIGSDEPTALAAANTHCGQAAGKEAVPLNFNAFRGHSVMTFDCR